MTAKAARPTDDEKWERASEHAWRYFEIHAGQRMSMFNYFIVLSGLLLTGIAGTLQASPRLAAIGIALGLLLALLSFLFWKIDQRAAFLVKHAEAAHILAEVALLPVDARLFSNEAALHAAAAELHKGYRKPWTFGSSLRLAFAVMAAAGLCAALLCAARASGYVDWEQAKVPTIRSAGTAPARAAAAITAVKIHP